jgi:hypothetical protein
MNGIIRCPTCGADMIEEEFENHRCTCGKPTIRRVLDIPYQWWLKTKEDPLIAIMGEDGTLYRFLPTRLGQPDKTTNGATESKIRFMSLERIFRGVRFHVTASKLRLPLSPQLFPHTLHRGRPRPLMTPQGRLPLTSL